MEIQKNLSECTPTQGLYYAVFHELPKRDIGPEKMPELLSVFDEGFSLQEKTVIQMGFGINSPKYANQGEISRAIDIPRRTVCDTKSRAIRKLRHPTRANTIKRIFDTPAN